MGGLEGETIIPLTVFDLGIIHSPVSDLPTPCLSLSDLTPPDTFYSVTTGGGMKSKYLISVLCRFCHKLLFKRTAFGFFGQCCLSMKQLGILFFCDCWGFWVRDEGSSMRRESPGNCSHSLWLQICSKLLKSTTSVPVHHCKVHLGASKTTFLFRHHVTATFFHLCFRNFTGFTLISGNGTCKI